jgi:hypothetical protein
MHAIHFPARLAGGQCYKNIDEGALQPERFLQNRAILLSLFYLRKIASHKKWGKNGNIFLEISQGKVSKKTFPRNLRAENEKINRSRVQR